MRKQYFIGINQRRRDVISELLDRGATLMFHYHFVTQGLIERTGFTDGEWMLITCTDDLEINEIRTYLDYICMCISEFKYEIFRYQHLKD